MKLSFKYCIIIFYFNYSGVEAKGEILSEIQVIKSSISENSSTLNISSTDSSSKV